jgi:transposase
LWARVPADAQVTVVLEPTRNAWVPLAAWCQARGATVVLVPPGQSKDLRSYYSKHTKNDKLDSRILARLPLLHPEGLSGVDDLGPADPLKRAVRRHTTLTDRRTACFHRLECLVELLGPAYADVLGAGAYGKAALIVLERYADPRRLRRLGRARLTRLLIAHSGGQWRDDKAEQLLDAAAEALTLWQAGGLDFAELAADIAGEVRTITALTAELATVDTRIAGLYEQADPGGIFTSAPGIAVTSAAGILGRLGDPNRFDNLAGIRGFTGLVPGVDESGQAGGHTGPTKAGDPGLRQQLYLAADRARLIDPTLAAKYHRLMVDRGKHHVSAICTLAPILLTRMATCWRNGQRYVLRDVDGREITAAEGRQICADRYKVPDEVRRRRRRTTKTKHHKGRTGRRDQESTEAAPASDPSHPKPNAERLDIR